MNPNANEVTIWTKLSPIHPRPDIEIQETTAPRMGVLLARRLVACSIRHLSYIRENSLKIMFQLHLHSHKNLDVTFLKHFFRIVKIHVTVRLRRNSDVFVRQSHAPGEDDQRSLERSQSPVDRWEYARIMDK